MPEEKIPKKVGNQVILSDEDQDEPTQEDIQEYAKWLGLNPEKDTDLLWIALEGIRAPLPDGWKPIQSENGELYFFNFTTGESRWDHPLDQFYKDLAQKELEQKSQRKEKKSSSKLRTSVKIEKKRKKFSLGDSERGRSNSKLQPLLSSNIKEKSTKSDDETNRGTMLLKNLDLNSSDTALLSKTMSRAKSSAHMFPSSEEETTSVSSGHPDSDFEDSGRSNPLAKQRVSDEDMEREITRKENESLRIEVEELKSKLILLSKEKSDVEEQLEDSTKKNEILQKENREIQEEYKILLNRQVQEQTDYENELQNLNKTKLGVQKEITSLELEKRSIENSIDIMKEEKELLDSQFKILESRSSILEKEVVIKENEVGVVESILKEKQENLKVVEEKINEHEERIRVLQLQESEISQKLSLFQKELQNKQQSSEDMMQANFRLSSQLSSQIKQLRQEKNEIRSMVEGVSELIISEMGSTVDLINSQCTMRLSEQKINHKIEVANLTKQFNQETEQFEKRVAELELLNSRLTEVVKKVGTNNQSKPSVSALNENPMSHVWRKSCLDSIQTEYRSLEKARMFIKQEKNRIKQQQESLQKARSEWKHDMSNLNQNKENIGSNVDLTAMLGSKKIAKHIDVTAPKMVVILKEVKKILEEQAVRLNLEVSQLNRIQQFVKLREEKLKLLKQTVENYSPSEDTMRTNIDSFIENSFENDQYLSFDNVSPHLIEKLRNIESEIKVIHDKIERESSDIKPKDEPHKRHSSFSQKWDDILSMYNNNANQIVLRKNKLTGFKDRISQWELDRGIECRVLDNHIQWMKKLYDEMGKQPY